MEIGYGGDANKNREQKGKESLASVPLAELNRKPANKGSVVYTGLKSQHHKAE